MSRFRSVLGLLSAVSLAVNMACSSSGAGHEGALDAKIQAILRRPAFQGAHWGMKFQWLDANEPLVSMNAGELFLVGSAFKVFIAATAFSTLGPDHRFRTPVYGTGPVVEGTLKGDLVLVAGGDLLLGGRVQADGSLALPDPDHSYGMAAGATRAPGDPLHSMREIAARVASQGIRRIEGRIRVDASMFREGKEDIAQRGVTIPVSPMMINDNVIDVTVTPGQQAGAPGQLHVSPQIGYVHIVNEVTTVAAGASPARPLRFTDDRANPDGTHTVRLTGDVPLGDRSLFHPYYVSEPVRFAEMAFTEALRTEGVGVDPSASPSTERNLLAEHVSPALTDEVKVMLKVSSNVHTVHFPYLVGALAGHEQENPKAAYDGFQSRLFEKAGLDPDPPGGRDGNYSPDFFVTFLAYMARQPYLPQYREAMPILGRDGSLTNVQVGSPAAGRVFAKTGTATLLGGDPTVAKALVGYIQLPNGRSIAFAEFMRIAVAAPEAMAVATLAGEALGEIATAVYEEAIR